MTTPNYEYEKRQKELAKKRKKDDKLKAKADRKTGLPGEEEGDASPEDSDLEENAVTGLPGPTDPPSPT